MSFNPYFSGCFSLSRCRVWHADTVRGFQSLFFWMLLSKPTSTPRTSRGCGFQSLFFWMLLSKAAELAGEYWQNKFQSLFFWMLLSKRKLRIQSAQIDRRFQSLFFWMLLSKARHTLILVPLILSFNPYFSGCFSLSCKTFGDANDTSA